MVLKKSVEELKIALRHVKIMKVVMGNQPVGIFKLSKLVNMPSHKVRYSLRILEQSGIVKPTKRGAVIREDANLNKIKDDLNEIKKLVGEIEKELEKI